jgi:phosphoserine phosphatase
MKLYLVRHGDTVANSRDRYIGSTDAALNAAGREQAQRLAARLRIEAIRCVWSSERCRARETAETIAAPLGLAVRVEPQLNEIDFGEWEGLSIQEIEARDPEKFVHWRSGDEAFRFPGGDQRLEFRARVRGALRAIVDDAAGADTLIVGHVGIVRTAVGDALGLAGNGLWSFKVEPASLHVLELGPERPVVLALNDTSHLR